MPEQLVQVASEDGLVGLTIMVFDRMYVPGSMDYRQELPNSPGYAEFCHKAVDAACVVFPGFREAMAEEVAAFDETRAPSPNSLAFLDEVFRYVGGLDIAYAVVTGIAPMEEKHT